MKQSYGWHLENGEGQFSCRKVTLWNGLGLPRVKLAGMSKHSAVFRCGVRRLWLSVVDGRFGERPAAENIFSQMKLLAEGHLGQYAVVVPSLDLI